MIARLLCELGLHRFHATRGHGLEGYWIVCLRADCSYWSWHFDRRTDDRRVVEPSSGLLESPLQELGAGLTGRT